MNLFFTKYKLRRHIRKSFVRMQKKKIPEAENCNPEEHYSPDLQLDKILANEVGCIPPWLNIKVDGIGTCQHEAEFEWYFEAVHLIQTKIQKLQKKCSFFLWYPTHYDDDTLEGNNELEIDLISMNNEVNN